MEININKIKVGNRYRKDMGNIQELAESIEEQGLLQPIGINENNELVFGQRRIEAYKLLGREEIEARFVNVTSILEGELTENEIRKQFNIEERVAIGIAVEEMIGNRQGQRTDVQLPDGRPEVEKGVETRDVAAQKSGFGSGRNYDRAKAIIEKATPEQIEKINTGKSSINKIHTEIKREEKQKEYVQRVEKIQETKELPAELPNLILCDPPWKYDFAETKNRQIENQYSTLTVPEMKDHLPATQDDCIMFMWATAPKLREAFELLDLWKFFYKTHAIWNKEIIGSGYWFRGQHEILIVATKGKCSPPIESLRVSSIFNERRTKHSKKPICVYEYIEKAFGDKIKLEMYCREARTGWLTMGDEVE